MKRQALLVSVVVTLLLWPAVWSYTADPPKPAAVVTAEDARAVLSKDAATRQQACQRAISEACQKYGFTLQARVVIVGDKVASEVLLVPSN